MIKRALYILAAVLALLGATACAAGSTEAPMPTSAGVQLTSPAFEREGTIPVLYTCDGENISPPLEWETPPTGTESLALIADDPDAPVGTWVHWVVYNIPAQAGGLPEGVPTEPELQDGTLQGTNSGRRTGYSGPCPPSGTHRYYFKLYALNTTLELDAGATKSQLLEAMEGHILAAGEWMGTYAR